MKTRKQDQRESEPTRRLTSSQKSKLRHFVCAVHVLLTEKVVSEQRVNVLVVRGILEVAPLRHGDELAVIPVEDEDPVGLALHDVRAQIVVETWPQHRRNPGNTEWKHTTKIWTINFFIGSLCVAGQKFCPAALGCPLHALLK